MIPLVGDEGVDAIGGRESSGGHDSGHSDAA